MLLLAIDDTKTSGVLGIIPLIIEADLIKVGLKFCVFTGMVVVWSVLADVDFLSLP